MSTVQSIPLNFNQNVSVSNDGGQLSSDAGMVLVKEFCDRIKFEALLAQNIDFHDDRLYCLYEKQYLATQMITQLVAGYPEDSAANRLKADPIFNQILAIGCASQPTLSRFINNVTLSESNGLLRVAQKLADKALIKRNQQTMVIDIDSTHSDTFGNQEQTDYNAHYQTTGYHPLLAFDGMTGLFLGAQLRPGNVYTSNGAEAFLHRLLEYYESFSCRMQFLIRGDSGFARPDIYQLAEEKQAYFVIRLKSNAVLKKQAECLTLYSDETDFSKTEIHYHEIAYQAGSWTRPYRVMIKSTRPRGQYLYRHEFIVTNLTAIDPEMTYVLYQNRGTMENMIKEIKSGFSFDKTNSHTFSANTTRMAISCVAYNVVQLMKLFVLPKAERNTTISVIRFKLLHIAGKVTQHARKVIIHLSNANVYDRLFWQTLENIQRFEGTSCA